METRSTGILVSGTDTGVGKTMVATAIIAALRGRGLQIGVYKPVETGCTFVKRILTGPDCQRLATAAGGQQRAAEVASYLFELPAAPLVAAEAAGRKIEPLKLAADCEALGRKYGHLVVEGAGGLMVPITDGYTYLDLAKHLRLSIVLVVGSRLGCINHALLSLAAIQTANVRILGYVVNSLTAADKDPVPPESNRRTLARFTRERDLGLFPHVPEKQRENYAMLGEIAERQLQLTSFI